MASKYKVYLDIGKDSNGKRIRKQFYGKTKKEAEEKRDLYLKQIDLDKRKYFAETFKIWLYEIAKNRVKPSSFDKYEGIFRNFFEECPFYNAPIGDIKPVDVQKYYNSLFTLGKSSNSIKNANKLLKQFFNYCVDNDYIIKSPASGKKVYIPIDEKNKKEVEVFTDDEIRKMVLQDEESFIKYAALISYATGMRRGEILGLKESDIDYKNKQIHINRTVVTAYMVNSKGNRTKKTYISIPKTYNSIRTIPLPIGLIDVLKSVISLKNNMLLNGVNLKEEYKDMIFVSKQGNLIEASNFIRSWKNFLKRCDIEYKKFHTLRHTYATKQFQAGIPTLTISKLLGHSSIDITLDIYTHISDKDKNKSLDTLQTLWSH